MDIENPLLARVYALDGDKDEIRKVYAEWADRYDEDTTKGMGYVAPMLGAAALASRVDNDAHVLDAGCGTGLVGSALSGHGISHIDGTDISQDMLAKAAQKRVYHDLKQADMTERLDIADDSYDGVACIGVFTAGHIGPEAFAELARVARPGAPIVASVHEHVWLEDGYRQALEGFERQSLIDIEDILETPYHQKEGYSCQLCLLRAA